MVITIDLIIKLCALFSGLAGVGVYISKAIKKGMEPVERLNARLDAHDDILRKDKKRLDAHDENIENLKNDIQQIMLASVVMLSHMETGNNTGEIRERKTEMLHYMAKR